MTEYARKLIAGNPLLGQRITVSFFHNIKIFVFDFVSLLSCFISALCHEIVGDQGQS